MKLVSSVKKGDGFKPFTMQNKTYIDIPITNNYAGGTNSKTLGKSTLSPDEDLLCAVETSRSISK